MLKLRVEVRIGPAAGSKPEVAARLIVAPEFRLKVPAPVTVPATIVFEKSAVPLTLTIPVLLTLITGAIIPAVVGVTLKLAVLKVPSTLNVVAAPLV